jgi:hypothetical protein
MMTPEQRAIYEADDGHWIEPGSPEHIRWRQILAAKEHEDWELDNPNADCPPPPSHYGYPPVPFGEKRSDYDPWLMDLFEWGETYASEVELAVVRAIDPDYEKTKQKYAIRRQLERESDDLWAELDGLFDGSWTNE